MLAELRRAMADAACTAAVCPDRKLRMPPFGGLALHELRMLRRLARRHAEVDRHVVLVAQAQPLDRGPGLQHALELARQRIAIGAALRIGGEALIAELGNDAHEVQPEMLFQNAEREPLAIGG